MKSSEAMEDALAHPRADGPGVRRSSRQPRTDGGAGARRPRPARCRRAVGRDVQEAPARASRAARGRSTRRRGARRSATTTASATGSSSSARARERPWKLVLAEWTARFSPGVVAAAFHGAIRTAHAVRSLEAQETKARVAELAEGLGYWAATYNALPESATPAKPPAGRKPSAAIAARADPSAEKQISYGNITDRLSPLDGVSAVSERGRLGGRLRRPSAFMSDLTETFAMVYLASATRGTVITFLHGVTGPAAVRTLLPYVSPEEQRRLLRYTWQACASFSSSAGGKTAPPLAGQRLPRGAHGSRHRDGRRALHQVHRGMLPRVRPEPEAGLHSRGDGVARWLSARRRRLPPRLSYFTPSRGTARRARAGTSRRRKLRPARSRSGRPGRRRRDPEAGSPSTACDVPS